MPGVTQRHLGLTRGATSGPGGQLARPSPWPRPQGAWGPRDPPLGTSSSPLSFFFQKPEFWSCSCYSCCSWGRFFDLSLQPII